MRGEDVMEQWSRGPARGGYYMARGGANVELGVGCWVGGGVWRDSQLWVMRAKTWQHARRDKGKRAGKRVHSRSSDKLAEVSFSQETLVNE